MKLHARIKDDGTLLLRGSIPVPDIWEPTETPGIYNCRLPACKYRRFSYRLENKRLHVQLHCFLKQCNCTPGECRACSVATADTSVRKKVRWENQRADGTYAATTTVMRVDPKPDMTLGLTPRANWTVSHTHTTARPDLQAIEDTLPPHQEGRDREVHFESDGAIVYKRVGGDWEPPRTINGYRRDPNNAWRFIPLWLPCQFRTQIGVRYANCGCIGVMMRCNNPGSPLFSTSLKHTHCEHCRLRKTLES